MFHRMAALGRKNNKLRNQGFSSLEETDKEDGPIFLFGSHRDVDDWSDVFANVLRWKIRYQDYEQCCIDKK
jgi:hypothetical protein